METLKHYYKELASIFGFNSEDFFYIYLKTISIPNTTTCGKEIKRGEGGWVCENCSLMIAL